MNNNLRIETSFVRQAVLIAALVSGAATLTACSRAMMMIHGTA